MVSSRPCDAGAIGGRKVIGGFHDSRAAVLSVVGRLSRHERCSFLVC